MCAREEMTTKKHLLKSSMNLCREILAQSKTRIVADYNGLPIGVLLLSREIYPVLDENLGMLCFIVVDKRFRGRGVGKAFVEEACNVLRAKGKHGMEVDVSVGNIPARIFYTKAGFYPFWLSKSYMPHDDDIFYRMDF